MRIDRHGPARVICWLLSITCISQADVSSELDALTGSAHTRVVWLQGGDRLMGGGKVMGFDSKSGQTTRILPASTNQNRPILCTDGHRVVVSIDYKVHVVGWVGSTKRRIADGIATDVWVDPATGLEWAVVREGTDNTGGAIARYPIDGSADKVVLWDQTGSGFDSQNWYQLSADGKVAVDFLPWDKLFVVDNGGLSRNGQITFLSRGCWSSLTPDNSYYSIHFPGQGGGHTVLRVFRLATRIGDVPLSIDDRPAETTDECYHPRFAAKGARFVTVTSGYAGSSNSNLAEVYVGKMAADYKSIEGWVRVTNNSLADYTADLWVGVEPRAPTIGLSADSLLFEAQEGGSAPAARTLTVSAPTGRLDNVRAVSDKPWLSVSLSGSTAPFTLTNTVSTASLSAGIYSATVTVSADNARPSLRTYRVALKLCGDSQPAAVRVEPATGMVVSGSTLQFQATVLDRCGRQISPQPAVQWSVSGNGNAIDNSGLFTAGDTNGSYTVTAGTGDIEGTAAANVVDFIPFYLKVNCGDNSPGFLADWEGDAKYLVPGHEGDRFEYDSKVSTAGVSDPPPIEIYRSFRYKNHRYSFSQVPPGDYRVRLHWAEQWKGTDRAMDFVIEGRTVLDNYIVVDDAGREVAAVKEFDVTVDDNGLQIECTGNGGDDVFLNGMEIVSGGSLRNTITVREPLAGALFAVGDRLIIKWTATSDIQGIVIQVSPDNGKSWYSITQNAITADSPSWGSYTWTIPEQLSTSEGGSALLPSDHVLFKVYNYQDETVYDVVDAPLTIEGGSATTPGALLDPLTPRITYEPRMGLKVTVPHGTAYRLCIFDAAGRRLVDLSGRGPRRLGATRDLAEGIYLLHTTIADRTLTRRLVIQR